MNPTGNRFLFYALAVLFFISFSNIVIHDFVCHEELHQLVNPVHHYFHNPARSSQDLVLRTPESSEKLFFRVIDSCPSDFTPSIFHPPD
ncbi:MAG: hypothetical protein OP8BY_0762 [Candidatus Saccharicenans subterraneus]|uniref:Uncharacterized protein n=1 Tax=Candidatus Saccharicenans subterraneus TaxID=2508984 RepID=A0A3E2BPX1_9BACT|nr:MAG: hypothetical protein OP8BY_0762 [Candidatus Saccharicenans subterraneum]